MVRHSITISLNPNSLQFLPHIFVDIDLFSFGSTKKKRGKLSAGNISGHKNSISKQTTAQSLGGVIGFSFGMALPASKLNQTRSHTHIHISKQTVENTVPIDKRSVSAIAFNSFTPLPIPMFYNWN